MANSGNRFSEGVGGLLQDTPKASMRPDAWCLEIRFAFELEMMIPDDVSLVQRFFWCYDCHANHKTRLGY